MNELPIAFLSPGLMLIFVSIATLRGAQGPGALARVEEDVDVLEEALLLDLLVGEDEADRLGGHARLTLVLVLGLVLALVLVLGLG